MASEIWRSILAAVGCNWPPNLIREFDPELWCLRAIIRARTDAPEVSERRFAELLEVHPTSVHALEQHGWILDRLGQRTAALAKFELARQTRQGIGNGMPDRPFFMRHRATSVVEIDGYTRVLRAGAARRGIFAYVARGHAYLTTRRPRLALLDYDAALRLAPHETGLLVARGEALAALGRHGEALEVLDRAVASRPRDTEALSSRAIVRLALGRIADADADWLEQLKLLPQEHHGARACVLLRLANYGMAVSELEQALEKKPDDRYLHLYLLAALRRLGRPTWPPSAPIDAWPGPLIALHHGRLTADEALQRADNPERRTEALFQIGIAAYAKDPAEALRLWEQTVENAAPDTIERAAAKHDIDRLRRVPSHIYHKRSAEWEMTAMTVSR